jgi:hypothetical protein
MMLLSGAMLKCELDKSLLIGEMSQNFNDVNINRIIGRAREIGQKVTAAHL